jgi:hypothetical protein
MEFGKTHMYSAPHSLGLGAGIFPKRRMLLAYASYNV